jgi:tRNA A-37 threonylcarbamoyl transferase component Bud32
MSDGVDARVLAGRYELESVLGQGGMADVYLATDHVLNRRVAVKILHQQYARDASFVTRFRREAQAAAGLNDPGVVRVYDTGSDDGTHFIVMEYVQGETLLQVIRDEAPLTPGRAASIARDVAGALAVAHAAGIVHRDIKPANIMITPSGDVRVMDFGIARAVRSESVTQTATVLGTATYFSPEQAQGQPVDARSDIYSLGVVLYEMLTGKPPFSGETAVAVAYKHVREDPAPPTHLEPAIPPALDAVVMKCLSKNPDNRYRSAEELGTDLDRYLAGQTVAATPVLPVAATQVVEPLGAAPATAVYRPAVDRRRLRRRRATVITLVVLLLAALGVGLGVLANTLLNGNVDTATVPCKVGKPTGQTTTALTQAGFTFQLQPTPSDTVPKDSVVGCDPSGTQPLDQMITVKVSTGSTTQTASVPDVFCLPLQDARAQLVAAGFVVRIGGNDSGSTCTSPGFVASQRPAAFTEAPIGSIVTLLTVPQPTTTPPPPTTTPPTTTPPTTTPPTTTPPTTPPTTPTTAPTS